MKLNLSSTSLLAMALATETTVKRMEVTTEDKSAHADLIKESGKTATMAEKTIGADEAELLKSVVGSPISFDEARAAHAKLVKEKKTTPTSADIRNNWVQKYLVDNIVPVYGEESEYIRINVFTLYPDLEKTEARPENGDASRLSRTEDVLGGYGVSKESVESEYPSAFNVESESDNAKTLLENVVKMGGLGDAAVEQAKDGAAGETQKSAMRKDSMHCKFVEKMEETLVSDLAKLKSIFDRTIPKVGSWTDKMKEIKESSKGLSDGKKSVAFGKEYIYHTNLYKNLMIVHLNWELMFNEAHFHSLRNYFGVAAPETLDKFAHAHKKYLDENLFRDVTEEVLEKERDERKALLEKVAEELVAVRELFGKLEKSCDLKNRIFVELQTLLDLKIKSEPEQISAANEALVREIKNKQVACSSQRELVEKAIGYKYRLKNYIATNEAAKLDGNVKALRAKIAPDFVNVPSNGQNPLLPDVTTSQLMFTLLEQMKQANIESPEAVVVHREETQTEAAKTNVPAESPQKESESGATKDEDEYSFVNVGDLADDDDREEVVSGQETKVEHETQSPVEEKEEAKMLALETKAEMSVEKLEVSAAVETKVAAAVEVKGAEKTPAESKISAAVESKVAEAKGAEKVSVEAKGAEKVSAEAKGAETSKDEVKVAEAPKDEPKVAEASENGIIEVETSTEAKSTGAAKATSNEIGTQTDDEPAPNEIGTQTDDEPAADNENKESKDAADGKEKKAVGTPV